MNTGIVDQNIDTTESTQNLGGATCDALAIADVQFDGFDAAANFTCSRLRLVQDTCTEDDLMALLS